MVPACPGSRGQYDRAGKSAPSDHAVIPKNDPVGQVVPGRGGRAVLGGRVVATRTGLDAPMRMHPSPPPPILPPKLLTLRGRCAFYPGGFAPGDVDGVRCPSPRRSRPGPPRRAVPVRGARRPCCARFSDARWLEEAHPTARTRAAQQPILSPSFMTGSCIGGELTPRPGARKGESRTLESLPDATQCPIAALLPNN